MFKYKPSQKKLDGRTIICGERDRKNLSKIFLELYSTHTIDDFNELMKPGSTCLCFNIKNEFIQIYYCDGIPMFIHYTKNKTCSLVPTVFTLWKKPNLLPILFVQRNVPSFIFRGADLMVPGITNKLEDLIEKNIDLGQIWSVCVDNNFASIAIGEIAMSKEQLQNSQNKGKILKITHKIDDLIFKSATGSFKTPNFDFDDDDKNSELSPEQNLELNKQSDISRDSEEKEQIPSIKITSTVIDLIIEQLVFNIIKKQFTDETLPINVSILWSKVKSCLKNLVALDKAKTLQFIREIEEKNEKLEDSHEQIEDQNYDSDDDQVTWELSEISNVSLLDTKWKNIKKFSLFFRNLKVIYIKEMKNETIIYKVNKVIPQVKYCIDFDCVKNISKPDNNKSTQIKKNLVDTKKNYYAHDIYCPFKLNSVYCDPEKEKFYTMWILENNLLADFESFLENEAKRNHSEAISIKNIRWFDYIHGNKKLEGICFNPELKNKLKNKVALTDSEKPSNAELVNFYIKNGFKKAKVLTCLPEANIEDINDQENAIILPSNAFILIKIRKKKRFIRTVISGIEFFAFIDPKILAQQLQKKCAAASCVGEDEELKSTIKTAVIIQGSVATECSEFLCQQYGLPPDLVKVVK